MESEAERGQLATGRLHGFCCGSIRLCLTRPRQTSIGGSTPSRLALGELFAREGVAQAGGSVARTGVRKERRVLEIHPFVPSGYSKRSRSRPKAVSVRHGSLGPAVAYSVFVSFGSPKVFVKAGDRRWRIKRWSSGHLASQTVGVTRRWVVTPGGRTAIDCTVCSSLGPRCGHNAAAQLGLRLNDDPRMVCR